VPIQVAPTPVIADEPDEIYPPKKKTGKIVGFSLGG
jgi:hypothetical protein